MSFFLKTASKNYAHFIYAVMKAAKPPVTSGTLLLLSIWISAVRRVGDTPDLPRTIFNVKQGCSTVFLDILHLKLNKGQYLGNSEGNSSTKNWHRENNSATLGEGLEIRIKTIQLCVLTSLVTGVFEKGRYALVRDSKTDSSIEIWGIIETVFDFSS